MTGVQTCALPICVLEQAQNAVAIVAIVLGGVNTPLGCDRVGPARRIVIRKAMDVVALPAEGAAAAAPANPAPTTMIECLRRFAGFISFIS